MAAIPALTNAERAERNTKARVVFDFFSAEVRRYREQNEERQAARVLVAMDLLDHGTAARLYDLVVEFNKQQKRD